MSDTQRVWFITGANRGIGLELTKQLLESPFNTIIAASRNPSQATALRALSDSAKGRVHLITLDISNKASVQASVKETESILKDRGLDYLINNAGINPAGFDNAFSMDLDNVQAAFATNVIGPAHVAQAYLPLVEKSAAKTIVNVSSTLGSLGTDFGPHFASYSISKAALNMLTVKQAYDRPDLTVVTVCPGHLKTDMGGESAPLEVSVGVSGVLKVIHGLTHEDSGKFINHAGERVPW
ncbi:NAD-P-binding protein [Trametes versicolor FP-101664 SS1]|uniref:NAD-P-binding protein n=1 Tax=Trametes versicolor (strain FP-101664) TaxID=717944 RepID=UPI0004621468|nr:NAD-P-binding protein [Trametes versicolor FP-101664 SS1]EIW54690.1 NAD-P-binding protein [Trametes versicolor FP-101664 SS1]